MVFFVLIYGGMPKIFSVLYEDGHGMDKIAILMEIGGSSLRTYASEMMGNTDINENKFLWIVKQMLMGLNEVHHAGQSRKAYGKLK
jgi:hypothetical protein